MKQFFTPERCNEISQGLSEHSERNPWLRGLHEGQGSAKRRVRARMPKHWAFLPSSGPSGHLLPKGEGLACGFPRLFWTRLAPLGLPPRTTPTPGLRPGHSLAAPRLNKDAAFAATLFRSPSEARMLLQSCLSDSVPAFLSSCNVLRRSFQLNHPSLPLIHFWNQLYSAIILTTWFRASGIPCVFPG